MILFGISPWRVEKPAIWGVMALSGVLGIGIGDTLYFHSLRRIGATRMAVLTTLYSPIVILASYWQLGEKLTLLQWLGIVLIVVAIYLIAQGNTSAVKEPYLGVVVGIGLGILSFIAMAAGMVIMKPHLEFYPLLWVNEVRLGAGILFLLVYLFFHPSIKEIVGGLMVPEGRKFTFWGSFIGAYLALVPWLGSLKYAPLSVASSLGQTSNIFTFILAVVFLKEPVSVRKVVGLALGLGGTVLVILGKSS